MVVGGVTVVSALADALADNPGRPLVTFYDGSTGERVELSVKTFDNWVSKIANLLGDDLLIEPGELVCVDLPTHWQSTVTLLAAWTAGLRVWLGGSGTTQVDVAASVVGPAARSNPGVVIGQPIACSLQPLGGPFRGDLPTGWLDFGREVPSQPDVLLTASSTRRTDVAVEADGGSLTHEQLVDQAFATAAEQGIADGGRLVTDANPTCAGEVAAGLVAPLVTGASVVLVTNCDAEALRRISDQERVTASYWVTR